MDLSNKIALWNLGATFAAILAAPLVALWIGGLLERRTELRREKLVIFGQLLSLRHQPLSPDAIRSLNLIDAVFPTDIDVREAWSRYYAALSDRHNNNPAGWAQWDEKKRDLIVAMARSVGLGKRISYSDVLRTYQPTWTAKADQLAFLEQDIRLAQAKAAAKELGIPSGDDAPS